jgi:hypothetical protein
MDESTPKIDIREAMKHDPLVGSKKKLKENDKE